MFTYILILLVLIVFALLIAVLKIGVFRKPEEYPYSSRETLCTPAERSFLGIVDKAIGNEYRVFAKVRLSDIIKVNGGIPASSRQGAFNKISGKHVDFVVCKDSDMSIVGVIELDDSSHQDVERKKRDEFLDHSLGASGIPILHIKAQKAYSIEAVKNQINTVLKVTEAGEKVNGKVTAQSSTKNTNNPVCPKCGAPLLKKIAKKGKYEGQNFWGCSNFPECRFIVKRSD